MRHVLAILSLALSAVGLCGCLPEERIVWSPDGTQALVRGPDKLYLAGADGKIAPILDERFAHVAWRPNAGFVGVRVIEATTWKDLLPYLSDPQRRKIELTAELLLTQLQARKENVVGFEPMVRGDLPSALLYIRDNAWDRVPQSLREQVRKQGGLKVSRPVYAIEAYRLADGKATRTARFATTLDDIHAMQPSPDGQVLAMITAAAGAEDPNTLTLKLMPAEPGAAEVTVAKEVGHKAAWSPGGDRLAWCSGRAGEESEAALWTLCEARVRDAEGKLLAKRDVIRRATVLAAVVDPAWLPDGGLAFISQQVAIPAPAAEPPPVNLFTLGVGQRKPQPVCSAEQARGLIRPQAMRLSPDGARAALFSSEVGDLVVVTLATGAVRDVVESGKAKSNTVPTWRNANQLCVVLADKSVAVLTVPADPAKPVTSQTISETWPKPLIEFLVTGGRPQQPTITSQPADK